MQNRTNVLIVENESLIVDILHKAFSSLNNDNNLFKLNVADSCEASVLEIDRHHEIDLALININIPPCQGSKVLFAEDISMKLKAKFPSAKIILFSSYKSNIKINSLLKTMNPDCLLVKSDITFEELINAIETVIIEPPYYSKTVMSYLRRYITQDIVIDKVDQLILYYLSIGTRTKDLPKLVHLSLGAVELRKRKLKEVFCIDKGGDSRLLEHARAQGFV
ncbi:response regulator [uncultured Psychroserpens sp.]|uniref:response regulator transcription factor n=1 Tax=uncultured Psychroserpens sp. TaxID=255436 RepID=UPI00260C4325|nr:response regulator [uncultured Psychroserpens sp.]